MKLITTKIPADKAYILPVGDIHWGDKSFKRRGLSKLRENLEWAQEHSDVTRIVLMGDIFNIAGRNEKTSPFESDPDEVMEAEDFFKDYAPLIIGAVRGNHEARMVRQFGICPLEVMCRHLGVPYMGTSGILKVQVGKRPEEEWYWQTYHLGVHHSTGGGGTLGNAVNRAVKLETIYEGCDAYLIGHNHQLGAAVRSIFYPTQHGIKERKIHYVSCGSYLDYEGGYAEEAMYAPSKLGSPRIRLDGRRDKHDVHVSI